MRKAAQNASSARGSPANCAPMTESRSQPRIRLATSVVIITADACAMLSRTAPSMTRPMPISRIVGGDGKEEAVGAEADPSDAAPDGDQDAGSLGVADRREAGPRGRDRRGRAGPRGGQRARQGGETRWDPQERGTPAPLAL